LSTILKALRRIEEQKADGFERPLREDVVLAPVTRRRGSASGLIAIAAVAFAATVSVLTLVHDRDAARPVAVAAPAPATAPAVSAPAPVEPPVALPRDALAEAPTEMERAAPAAAAAPGAVAEGGEPDDFVMLNPQARGRSPIAVVSEPPPPAIGATAPKPTPAPAIRKAPAAPSASLRVLRTSWHPHPDKRTAWVQMPGAAAQTVHEGDRVGAFVVREIEPAAVVLSGAAGEVRRGVGSP
jgi:hypothetical protein